MSHGSCFRFRVLVVLMLAPRVLLKLEFLRVVDNILSMSPLRVTRLLLQVLMSPSYHSHRLRFAKCRPLRPILSRCVRSLSSDNASSRHQLLGQPGFVGIFVPYKLRTPHTRRKSIQRTTGQCSPPGWCMLSLLHIFCRQTTLFLYLCTRLIHLARLFRAFPCPASLSQSQTCVTVSCVADSSPSALCLYNSMSWHSLRQQHYLPVSI